MSKTVKFQDNRPVTDQCRSKSDNTRQSNYSLNSNNTPNAEEQQERVPRGPCEKLSLCVLNCWLCKGLLGVYFQVRLEETKKYSDFFRKKFKAIFSNN